MRRRRLRNSFGFIVGTLAAATLLLSGASVRAYQSSTTVYPGSICTSTQYDDLMLDSVGSGEWLPGGSSGGAYCPIMRTNPTWENVEVYIVFDQSEGYAAKCGLVEDDAFAPTGGVPIQSAVDPCSIYDQLDCVGQCSWLGGVCTGGFTSFWGDLGMSLTNAHNSGTFWTSFTGTDSDNWQTNAFHCGADDAGDPEATVQAYYVFESTNN
jgi:hypothetical protein